LSIPFEAHNAGAGAPIPQRDAGLRKHLDVLLEDLCVRWGFCNRLTADDLLSGPEALSAQVFAKTVLQAEGMNVDLEKDWRRRIEDLFVARFGGEF